ncbi:MAG TPA: rhodanese-like domain-containing protein [Chthoniobacteraceae bacterium]|nr:rhodanese-like domain-containing protein [Chthoniobacteraceae bacterium]
MLSLEITVQEAKALLDSKAPLKLVDVREADEFAVCKIDGAELLPLSAFAQEFAARLPDKAQKIVLYCHHGMRSLRAAEFLAEQGYTDVKSVSGGIDAWAREIDQTVPRY